MAVSSNSNTEPKVGAGVLSNFNPENKSNGNFSGGHINPDTEPKSNGNSSDDDINFKLDIHNPFDTKETPQPTFNTDDVFKPTLSGNLDIDLPKINNNNNSSNNTTYSNNSTKPTMTVDEVYGKSNNQPVVEKQGDYSASSNEKSNVETSTFGKQDEVSVTPLSVTENKGIVGNAAIQSVEGLDFQQKDKASVDVLDSKKKRDEVEAEDKANSMRDKLKAIGNNAKQEEGGEDFRIGDRDEDVANAKAKVDQLTQQESEMKLELAMIDNDLSNLEAKADIMQKENQSLEDQVQNNKSLEPIGKNVQAIEKLLNTGLRGNLLNTTPDASAIATVIGSAQTSLDNLASKLGIDSIDLPTNSIEDALQSFQTWSNNFKQEYFNGLKDFSDKSITAYRADTESQYLKGLDALQKYAEESAKNAKELEAKKLQLQQSIEANKSEKAAAEEAYNKLVSEGYVGAEAVTEPTADEVYKDLQAQGDSRQAELNAAYDNRLKANVALIDANKNTAKKADFNDLKEAGIVTLSDGNEITMFTYVGKDPDVKAAYDARNEAVQNLVQADRDYAAKKSEYDSYVNSVKNAKAKAEEAAAKAKAEEEAVTEPTADEAAKSNAEEAVNLAKDAINNSKDATPEQKAQAEEAITNLEDSRKALEAAAAAARSGNPADMVAYQKALETYNKNLKKAKKIGNRFTQTDFNDKYTKAVAQANDFEVTLSDGTVMEYSDFATEEATKSPQYAKAMYEAKAAELEEKHPILAKIERWKAKMSQTWLGSKLTFADNKVRDQFNQMAKTDMRATYAAYNNVLDDETGKYSEDDKAEASKAINQAKALMTASVALQASTGFLSSIGDSVDDGTFGTTDPEARNAWQKTLNTVDNIIRITLGLGITPAANKAYQNMYYMAGDKVNTSLLFNKDFDGDGFAMCQEYGNHAATAMIAGAGEAAIGVTMLFNPATVADGINLIADAVSTFSNGLYGVRNEVDKSQKYTQEVLEYFKEAENIAESSGNEEAVQEITNAITQIENFELKADEVGNLDNWLEGSGSNTADNGKFNQALSYDEWLKLIEADPVMKEYAKSIAKKKDKNAQKDNADTGVNS